VSAATIRASSRWLRLVFAAFAVIGAIAPAHSAAIGACNNPSFESVLQGKKTSAKTAAADPRAKAYWLNRNLIQWPKVSADWRFRLYAATNETIVATAGVPVTGSDQAFDLKVFSGTVPPELSARFKFVADGVLLQLPLMTDARSRALHHGQLLLVKEDAGGRVVQFTRLQIPGALDDWYASAALEAQLGVTIQRASNTSTSRRHRQGLTTTRHALGCSLWCLGEQSGWRPFWWLLHLLS